MSERRDGIKVIYYESGAKSVYYPSDYGEKRINHREVFSRGLRVLDMSIEFLHYLFYFLRQELVVLCRRIFRAANNLYIKVSDHHS